MEKLNSKDNLGASIQRGAGSEEVLKIKGTFHLEVLSPHEQYREKFIKLRDRVEELSKSFDPRAQQEILKLAAEMEAMQYVRETDIIHNTVVTVGKNLALDTILSGSAYTVTGPFMGLISSVSWSAINAADTMASHAGWTEAGNANAPTYTAPRKTLSFNAASGGSKALSSNASFAITGSGTVKGAFVVFGSGAVSTIDSTAGTLLSAGLFSGGDKTVGNGDTLSVSYSLAL